MNEIKAAVESTEKTLILPHINADGDAVGSAFALAAFIRKLGKTADVVFEEPPEAVYSVISSECLVYPCEIGEYDLAISVDCSSVDRLGKRAEIFTGKTVNIDHHKTNTEYASINYVGENAATGEIIYKLIETFSRDYFDKYIGECLYTAISTDTGSFRYSNTTPETLRTAASLLELGIDSPKLNSILYETNTLGKLKFQAEVINNMQMYLGNRICLYTLTKEHFESMKLTIDDVSSVSNLLLSIEGVEIGAFIHERTSGELKVSLRSRGKADVSEIARPFGGGGHMRASGYSFTGDVDANKNILLERLSEVL